MKTLIALVVAVGLGATFATVLLGTRVKEATVVANPYEEGLRYDERRRAEHSTSSPEQAAGSGRPRFAPRTDASAGPSEVPPATSTGDTLTLEISPQPPRAMSELVFTVRASRDGRPLEADVALTLSMPAMRMMENRVALAPAGAGVYRGTGAVVRCPSGGRSWAADVTATPKRGAPVTRRFGFEVTDEVGGEGAAR